MHRCSFLPDVERCISFTCPATDKYRSAGTERGEAAGTLIVDNLLPGSVLWLLSTGTGLAPFMSVIRDPAAYERYDHIVLAHTCRYVRELAYRDYIMTTLPKHEFLGEQMREQLIYYPTVTREPFSNSGRITDLIRAGTLFSDTGLPPFSPERDRIMLCGSSAMLRDTRLARGMWLR